ncbi:MAG TPA: hypothetical protein VKG02_01315, partial [Blastocatellia bacterium]|nr:hypothetical protein [Blastocatellia bacterium]
MNPPKIKHLNLRSIYTVLAIGFALLLFLIGVIGMGSSSKLKKISGRARESGDDYMERLTAALSIREAAAEFVLEARLSRARQLMKVPNPAFKSEFDQAKKRFQEEIENGKNIWLKHKGPGILSKEELEAWGAIQTTSEKFMDIQTMMEKLKIREDQISEPESNSSGEQTGQPPQAPGGAASGGQPQSELQQDTHDQIRVVQSEFLKLRKDLKDAAEDLTSAVTRVQYVILKEFAIQEERAATEIDHTTWGTLALGVLVAALTLMLARNQIMQLRQASRQEQEAKDFARSIFDSQANDILVVNNKGELLAVNQAFLKHFDLPAPSDGPPEVLKDYRAALTRLPEVAA